MTDQPLPPPTAEEFSRACRFLQRASPSAWGIVGRAIFHLQQQVDDLTLKQPENPPEITE